MGRRIAFLLGNASFLPGSGFKPLRGPLNDVEALSDALSDADRGGFEVRAFRDATSGEIKAAIDEELGSAKRDDMVLIAYAGHGKPDRNGRLCLATADTKATALYSTSIPASHLREMVDASDCGTVVLLLDCCYSGAATNLRGDVESELRSLQSASGLYILTASSEFETAREGEAGTARESEVEASGVIMGKFTAALVDGINSGAADRDKDGEIKLQDLVDHVRATLRGQKPQYFAARAGGDPLISLSPATARLPEDVLQGLIAEEPLARMGAAWRLGRLARSTEDAPRAARAKLFIINRLRGEDGERDQLVREALLEALPYEIPGFTLDNSDLTGVWKCNDGLTYYIRQLEDEIWWYGTGSSDWQTFANVAHGHIETGGIIDLKWTDLPKSQRTRTEKVMTTSAGELVLKCNYSIQRGHVTGLTALRMTGQFGGSEWQKHWPKQPK